VNELIENSAEFDGALVTRGNVNLELGNYPEAKADLEKALKLDPIGDSTKNAYAWFLATCPEDKYRDGKKALEFALKACEMTKYKEANNVDTLAACYAEAGNFKEAIKWQEAALADKDFADESGEDAKKRLEGYKNKKPHREVKKP
jgi:tetratricopeptide (TPR) repeat protein